MSTTFPPPGDDVETAARMTPRFNADGLIAAIAQDATSGAVLMLAWMNAEALAETLATGRATYWSRSRGRLWRKGEESGHIQRVREMRVDCDQDAILLLVDQTGAACHTGAATCFYRRADSDGLTFIAPPLADRP